MFASIIIVFLCLNTVQHASLLKNENISNEIINYYVNATSTRSLDCGLTILIPCKQIDNVFKFLRTSDQYIIHVSDGQYDHDLFVYDGFKDDFYPSVDIASERDALINITGQLTPIGKIIVNFSKFSIDFGDLYFLIDDDKSSLKFSSCNLFRNAGSNAINTYSLAIVNHGSLILEKVNIDGDNLKGNEPLIQSASPKLIQFTSLTVTNITLTLGNTSPLLLSVTELKQESNIAISDVYVNKNTAGTQALAGIILIHSIEDQNQIQNEYLSVEPILLVENSEITQNTLAPISETCSIQIEGLNPQQILIKNSTIINRSQPNNNKQYELKIALPKDCEPKDLISQFQQVDFGIILNPVTVKTLPDDQFQNLTILTEQYTNIQVSSNGQESCTSYIANFHNDVRTLSCAMIIIRAQETLGQLKGVPRQISISGLFTENDLRTDGLTVSFKGTNFQTQANMISFQPYLPISTDPIDSSLFRVYDDGAVTLSNLFIQRSNQNGSEKAPIVVIISDIGQQSNGLQKNSPGQLVIDKCILEGGNSISSDVWYNLGLAETCNVGYGAAIVADGQSIVQISGSTIKTFEGPAVRALNGASVSIDKNTILDNNGLRNRNTLSSMETNIVCEGGIGITTIDIALDNVTSINSTGNGWIFSPSGSNCAISATLNDERALPRSIPQIDKANVVVNITNKQDKITVNGKFFEPCLRTLVLELHEKNKAGSRVTLEFGIESNSNTVNWIDSENIIFQFPYIQLKDLDYSVEWEVSIYEFGNRELANWASTQPVEEGKVKQKKTNLVVAIVVPVVVIIIAIVVIILIALYVRNKNKGQQSKQYRNESNTNMTDIDVTSINEDQQQEQTDHKMKKQGNVPETDTSFFTDSDIEQRGSSDHSITATHNAGRRLVRDQADIEQKDIQQKSSSKEQDGSKQHTAKRSDTNLAKKDREILKDEMNKKTKKSRHQSKDTRKSSKERKERNNKSKSRKDKEKRTKSKKTSNKKQKSESLSSDLSQSTTSSNDSSDSDSSSVEEASSSSQNDEKEEEELKERKQAKRKKNKSQKKSKSKNKSVKSGRTSKRSRGKDQKSNDLSKSKEKLNKDKENKQEDDDNLKIVGEDLLDNSQSSEVVQRISLDGWQVNEDEYEGSEIQIIPTNTNTKNIDNNKSKSNTKNESGNESQSMQSADISSKKQATGSEAKLKQKRSSAKHSNRKDTKDSPKPDEYQEEEQSNDQTDNTTASEEQTSSSSSSSSSSYISSSSFSNSNEKKKENKRKQTTEKQRKKKKAKQLAQEDSSDSSNDNQEQNKQNDVIKMKSLDSNPPAKVKNHCISSESNIPSIQGLIVYAEMGNNGEMKYQPKDAEEKKKSKQSEIKQNVKTPEQKKTKTKQIKKNKSKKSDEKQHDNKGPENTKKEDIVVKSSNTNLQSNEKNKEVTSGSLPPSIEDGDVERFAAFNIPENYL